MSFDHVTVTYGDVAALADATLRVDCGSVHTFVGPNGSGKTTALHVAAGLVEPASGSASTLGRRPAASTTSSRIAFVPDKPRGLDHLTVDEMLALYASLHSSETAPRRADPLVEAFRLGERRNAYLDSLSTGMRRQVALIAAASVKPDLLIVDEASATLDPEAVVVLRTTIRELSALGTSVLLATQDLGFAEKVSDEVTLLVDGRVRASGRLGEVTEAASAVSLEDAFLKLAERSAMVEEVRHALAIR
ncbi:MAG: ABC transporter ATP-binding protein [Actinomycetota bacterium]